MRGKFGVADCPSPEVKEVKHASNLSNLRVSCLPVTKEIPAYEPGRFNPVIKNGILVDLEYVKARSGEAGFCLVDD